MGYKVPFANTSTTSTSNDPLLRLEDDVLLMVVVCSFLSLGTQDTFSEGIWTLLAPKTDGSVSNHRESNVSLGRISICAW